MSSIYKINILENNEISQIYVFVGSIISSAEIDELNNEDNFKTKLNTEFDFRLNEQLVFQRLRILYG